MANAALDSFMFSFGFLKNKSTSKGRQEQVRPGKALLEEVWAEQNYYHMQINICHIAGWCFYSPKPSTS